MIALRRLWSDPSGRVGVGVLATLVLCALVGPAIVGDPLVSHLEVPLADDGGPPGPSGNHLLGLDPLHRDVLSRLVVGARASLFIAIGASILATAIGALAGFAAAMATGGRLGFVDGAIMRIVDALLAMPGLLLLMAIAVFIGPTSTGGLALILGATSWTGIAKVMRSETLRLLSADFVMAARALGTRRFAIVARHLAPNLVGPLAVLATGLVPHMILAEAALSYLSLGVPPPAPSWGRALYEAQHLVGARPLLIAAPGAAILFTALCFHRIGEGLRRAYEPAARAAEGERLRDGAFASRTRRIPLDFALAVVVFGLFALAPRDRIEASTPPERVESNEPQHGGTLRLATFVNVRALDPAIAYDEGSRSMAELIFAPLIRIGGDGRPEPVLCERFDAAAGDAEYTCTLRAGLRFADGTELDGADVERTILRTLHPQSGSPGASHYADLVGFAAFRAGDSERIEGIETAGRQVTFRLARPRSDFPALMSQPFVAPVCTSMGPFADRRDPAEPCGAGGFRLVHFDPEVGARFERNPHYFEPDRPYLDAIHWEVNVRPKAQRYRFETGELDVVRDLTASDIAAFERSSYANAILRVPSPTINAIFLNVARPPFDNADLRRAVALAIDPSALAKLRPDVRPLRRVLPDGMLGGTPDRDLFETDLEAARQAMADAGYPYDPVTGSGGLSDPVAYLTVPGSFEEAAAQIYAQQLARIGIELQLQLVSFATYLAVAAKPDGASMGWMGWSADYPDPINFLAPTLTSSAITPGHSQNFAFYRNEAFDETVRQAQSAASREAYAELLWRAEELVRRDVPWVPTYSVDRVLIHQPRVHGLEPTTHRVMSFESIWLDDAPSPSTEAAR